MEAVKTTTNLTQTPVETQVKGKAVKKSGKRIGYNYIILKSLKESQKNDVVKCLYIKSLTNFGICVIKEGTYGDSKDKDGRDIKDKLIWQKQLHEELQNKVRIPRFLGSFEENGNYYLVIERIKGKSLYKACREKSKELREGLITGNKIGLKFLDYMIQLVTLLDTLHQNKVIHRDVSSNNFMIMPSGKVAVIDMELSYSFEKQMPSPPFQLGTYGYMSPQQERRHAPNIKDDIFSVGAIMLQMWTGISPSKLTNAIIEELREKVYFLVPDKEFADIILQCLDPEPEKRPTLIEVRYAIEKYKKDLQAKKQRPLSKNISFHKEQIIDTIQRAIGTLSSPLLADAEKGWFTEDRKVEPNPDKKQMDKAWYASFGMGAAGVLYFLSQAKKNHFDVSTTHPHIQKALSLTEQKYINRIDKKSPSFCLGSSGIAASLAIAIKEKLIEPQPEYFNWVTTLITVENSKGLDFTNGIAGQGLAFKHCVSFLQEKQAQQYLERHVQSLLAEQAKDGSWLNEKNQKKAKATKGFARGVAGIVYFLLEYAMQYQEREPLNAAKRGLEWLVKTSVHHKGTIDWRSSKKKEIPAYWAEGAPGIALAFIKAYSLLGETKYKKYATGALLCNPKNILDNNLGQQYGLSGLGEVYLEAYQVLGDSIWQERADWIAQAIMHLKKEHTEHGPYWLVDHERQPISEFMNGVSGVLHFLLRYCYPDHVGFLLSAKEQ